jgi:hypothetical protein
VSTYPPPLKTARDAEREDIIRTSNERWTRRRTELETKLARFLRRKFATAEMKKATTQGF